MHNTSVADVKIRAESLCALSGIHQVDNDSLEIATLYCVNNFEASSGRAERYSICNHQDHSRRLLSTMDEQCKCTHM